MEDFIEIRACVYWAVERGNTLAQGKQELQKAKNFGAKVEQYAPAMPMSEAVRQRGFKEKVMFRVTLPNGRFTSIYWQPNVWAKDETTDGLWYGRATQWSMPA